MGEHGQQQDYRAGNPMNRIMPRYASILFAFLLLSCGIDDYYYLEQISESNIRRENNTLATINLPAIPASEHYFRYYKIYYRIYISAENTSSEIQTSQSILTGINPSLYSDYTAIYPSTDPLNTTASTDVGRLFSGRNYYELELSGDADIKAVLTPGRSVTIGFPGNNIPNISINNTVYNLCRSNNDGTFTPEPEDRLFLNSEELTDNAKAINTINADVAANSASSSGQRYTYVSMYFVKVGVNNTFSYVYSKPTHANIFKLPERY
jgi:hypothetical protein